MKYFACYEKSNTGSWTLVVYHDGKPGKSVNASDPERSNFFAVPPEMIDIDGSPRMGAIKDVFPPPEY
jgi:hypothetical protein